MELLPLLGLRPPLTKDLVTLSLGRAPYVSDISQPASWTPRFSLSWDRAVPAICRSLCLPTDLKAARRAASIDVEHRQLFTAHSESCHVPLSLALRFGENVGCLEYDRGTFLRLCLTSGSHFSLAVPPLIIRGQQGQVRPHPVPSHLGPPGHGAHSD